MIPIRVVSGLPLVSVTLRHGGGSITLDRFLMDTGSAGTLVRSDLVEQIGLIAELNDPIDRIRGVGGSEFVVTKRVESITVGSLAVTNHAIELGALEYGFELHGILGRDFLSRSEAQIDLQSMRISRADEGNLAPGKG
jgi:hypothetical protein